MVIPLVSLVSVGLCAFFRPHACAVDHIVCVRVFVYLKLLVKDTAQTGRMLDRPKSGGTNRNQSECAVIGACCLFTPSMSRRRRRCCCVTTDVFSSSWTIFYPLASGPGAPILAAPSHITRCTHSKQMDSCFCPSLSHSLSLPARVHIIWLSQSAPAKH